MSRVSANHVTTTTRPSLRLTRRVLDIEVSPTLAVLNKATELIAKGFDVVDFGPGEPDFGTPLPIAEAGKRAIDQGFTKYTNAAGTKMLRDAIAAWVSFPDQVAFAGGTPVFAKTEAANLFRPTLEDIAAVATERTRGVIINSPCNPTGAVIAEKELGRIIEWCASRDTFLVYDETYEFFVYGNNRHTSAARWFDDYPDTVIVVNSMSKTFAMTGWRLGYAIATPAIIAALGKIQSHSTSNPSSIAQQAALEALHADDSVIQTMYDAYRERREMIVPALNAIDGVRCADPDGAFYVFPEVKSFFGKGTVRDSQSFANYLLDDARVAVVPGSAFGNDDFVRISYATSTERIREGVRRITAALAKL